MHTFGSRRHFLRGASGVGVAIPFLASLAGRHAAAAYVPPKRLVVVYLPNNDTVDFPAGATGALALAGSYHGGLAKYQDRMVVVNGLRGTGSGHSFGHTEVLSGHAHYADFETRGETLDQFVKRRERVRSAHAILAARANVDTVHTTISRTQAGSMVAPRAEPFDLYRDAIGLFPAAAAPGETADRAQRLRGSLLAHVAADYRRVRALVSADERRLLESHLGLLEEREKKFNDPQPATPQGCASPREPRAQYDKNQWHGDATTTDDKARAHLDVIAAGVICGITPVATFMFGGAQGSSLNAELGALCGGISFSGGQHKGQHDAVAHYSHQQDVARKAHFRIRAWQSDHTRYLLDRLDVPDVDGISVLDRTLVVVMSELGIVRSGQEAHAREDIGALVIGGGALGTLKLNQRVHAGGADYGRFLYTLVQALGYEDVASFGYKGRLPYWPSASDPGKSIDSRGFGDQPIAAMLA